MAVFIAQARIGIALFEIDEPAFDAVRHDMLFWNGVSRTVELANIAVHAKVLDAELARLILSKWQVRRDEAGTKASAVFFVDQTAVTPKFAEANLVKNGNRLNGACAIVMRQRRIAKIANISGEICRNLRAFGIDPHRFFFHG